MRHAGNWPAQLRQNAANGNVDAEIVVEGVEDWGTLFLGTVTLEPPWSTWCGGTQVPELVALTKEAEVNNVSIERVVLGRLISRGYVLEELVVSFENASQKSWGKGIWYKEHPSYEKPSEAMRQAYPDADALHFSYIVSMFKTEHAGDQKYTLLSMQMVAQQLLKQSTSILLHKSLIFHRAVLSPPKTD